MSAVMIGIDPHKGSHTAVALDGVETKARRDPGEFFGDPGRAVARMGQGGPSAPGRSKARRASAAFSPSSW
jgi:hypothetical protein